VEKPIGDVTVMQEASEDRFWRKVRQALFAHYTNPGFLARKGLNYMAFRCRALFTAACRPPLIGFAFLLAALLAHLRRRTPDSRSALILPSTTSGNLGDEAVYVALISELRKRAFERICIIDFDGTPALCPLAADSITNNLEHNPPGLRYVKFVLFASHFSHLYIFGADVMDGSWGLGVSLPRLRLARLGSKLGLKSAICSFSVSESPHPKIIRRFKGLEPGVSLNCRDEVSLRRLRSFIGNERGTLCADLAFLLKPDHQAKVSQEAAEWIATKRSRGKLVMGLNMSDLLCGHVADYSPLEAVGYFAAIYKKLRKQLPGLSIVHLPHSSYPERLQHRLDDFDLAMLFHQNLPAELQSDSFLIPRTVRATEIRSICGRVDFVLSGRMHLSIASLSQGTPVFGVSYHGKFEGCFRHFGLDNMTVSPQDLPQVGKVTDFLLDGVLHLPDMRKSIARELTKVQALSLRNIGLGDASLPARS
jgi:polysaccharide pyruvyl transferase WcaK-like protein